MRLLTRRAAIVTVIGAAACPVRAEVTRLRISHGYSIGYLPLIVMRERQLIQRYAARAGLGDLTIEWSIIDGGNNINDAMLAGAVDIAGIGIPGFLVLRDRTLGRPQEMIGISALNSGSLWLNTIDPRIRTLADYTSGDRIALPGIKTSYAAVALQMAVAKRFGFENYAKFDPLTVGMPHPDAYAALMSGKTEITSHLASAPFSYQEARNPRVFRVLSTAEELGPMSILLAMTQQRFAKANAALMGTFVAAQEEANAVIRDDRNGAVSAYLAATGLRVPGGELLEMLADPENGYSATPAGSLTYATFLARTGVLRVRPAAWTDLFLPELGDRKGS